MEKTNPLLPFAFTSSAINDTLPLNTTPRDRTIIDENASSQYHTRKTHLVTPESDRRIPIGDKVIPSLKRKLTSFNERDDIKRVDIETNNELPPSSPPIEIPLLSEFDTTAHDVPESPKNLPSEPDLIYSSKIISSEADFGIDRFNRFKGSFEIPSSTSFEEDEFDKTVSYNKARNLILQAFENIETVINLESMNLYDIPDEIKDLNNLVIFPNEQLIHTSYQLYLSHNKLIQLPPALFKFTRLQVLVLRHNKLTSISPLIEKLIELTDLSLSTNKITWFPFQLLHLPKLTTFVAGPNPLLPIPEDAIECNYTYGDHKCHHRTIVDYISTYNSKVPSLKNLCLDKIAKYDISYKETKIWKKQTPKLYHNLMAQAIAKGKQHDVCNQCDLIVVEPLAQVFEWWDILENKNIAIRKQFCCQGCVEKYLTVYP